MAQAPLTIGRLACTAGVNVETVRYYLRLGFTLQEIGKLLDLGNRHCEASHKIETCPIVDNELIRTEP